MKSSTRAFFREAQKTSGYSLFDWVHAYIYTRWPYLYIGVATGEHRLTRFFLPIWQIFTKIFQPNTDGQDTHRSTFADTYHAKVVPLDEAKQLVTMDKEISLKDLEQVIPYTRARDIVLQNPDHIVVLECPCRAVRPHPCEPLDVCLIIGEPFAGFVVEHHPHRSRRITQAEAVEILRAEHERGHVHHAFFKDVMLDRFYAICNCCSCCCGAMQAWHHGTPMLASSGFVSRVHTERCLGCGDCIRACQFGALQLKEGRVFVNEELCMGCGVCVSKCERDVHVLERDKSRGEPLEIHQLIADSDDEIGFK